MVSILHHGAVNGVTGSCHQLVLDSDTSVLIDCGLFQGAESAGRELDDQQIDFSTDTVKALFVTHCHIDHVGRLPWLLAAGFDGPIYASEATAHLLPLVIEDALKLGVTRKKQLIGKVLIRLKQLLVPLKYGEWIQTDFGQKLEVRYQPAGHILGSAYIEFKYQGEIIVFSGDLGAPYAPLLPAPKPPWRADRLVIESTYGDKLHEQRRDRKQQLKRVISHALKNAGTVLIPAFSIGRTQELLYELESIIHSNKNSDRQSSEWSALDIIVDSPLAAKFTEHYRELQHLWDAEAQQRKRLGQASTFV